MRLTGCGVLTCLACAIIVGCAAPLPAPSAQRTIARPAPSPSPPTAALSASSAVDGKPPVAPSITRDGYATVAARLTSISVVVRFPRYSHFGSRSLQSIGEAIDQASADMFVHYLSHGAPSPTLRQESADDVSDAGSFHFPSVPIEKWDPNDANAKGLAKYGGKLEGYGGGNGSWGWGAGVLPLNGYPPPLADGTPGLVWDVDEDRKTARFVTFDGAAYDVALGPADKVAALEPGSGPTAAWPAPVTDALLDRTSATAKFEPKERSAFDKAESDFAGCGGETWESVAKKRGGAGASDAALMEWSVAIHRACAKQLGAVEQALIDLIERRVEERRALFDRAKARVSTVHADP